LWLPEGGYFEAEKFPWPTPMDTQRARIEQIAQVFLDARTLYPNASLADLYDKTTLPWSCERSTSRMTRL